MSRRTSLSLALAALSLAAGFVLLAVQRDRDGARSLDGPVAEEENGPSITLHPATPPESVLARLTIAPAEQRVEASMEEAADDSATGEAPADGFRVKLVDPSGRPRGDVELELCVRSKRRSDKLRDVCSGRTDRDGIALIPLEEAREKRKVWEQWGGAPEWAVTCDIPNLEPIKTLLEDLPEAGDTITLVLPPVGSLFVRILDHTGKPFTEDAHVSLVWRPADAPGNSGQQRIGDHRRDFEDGVARYAAIGLGTELLLSASATAGDFASANATILGPKRDGEVVEATLTLGPRHPKLTGTILGEDDQPVAEEGMYCRVWSRSGLDPSLPHRPIMEQHFVTDAQGRFEWPWGLTITLPADAELEVERRVHRFATVETFASRMPMPRLPDGESKELGTIRLERPPLLVSGTAIDGEGAPLRHASIWLRHTNGEGPDRKWFDLDNTRTGSDDSGNFEVRSFRDVRELGIFARKHNRRDVELRGITPGETGVLVQLLDKEQARSLYGVLEVGLLLDDEAGAPDIELLLRHSSGDRRDSYAFGGKASFAELRPGTHELTVRTTSTHWVLTKIEGIEVLEGQENQPTRVESIDLRGALVRRVLRLKDDAGRPIREQRVAIHDLRGKGGTLRTDEDGRLIVLAPRDLAEVSLRPYDYQEQLVQLTTGEPELVFVREE